MKYRVYSMVAWILFFLLSLLEGCNNERLPEVVPSGKTIKVGVIAPMTGVDSVIGKNGIAGIRTALKVQPYLLNGDKIDLVVVDDRSDTKATVVAAQKLVGKEKVAAMLVLSRSLSVLALSEFADTLKTPFLAVISSHPSVTKSKWAAQLMFDDEDQGTISALYVRDELLMDRVTVFRQINDPHSVFLADKFAFTFKESGGDVRVVDIGAKDIDFEALLAEMGHQYLDFLYMPVKAMHVLKIERAVRALGLQSQMMMSDGVASNVILEFKEDIRLLNGLLAVDVFSTRRKKTPYGQIMKSSFTKSFQEPGTTIAALGCEGMSYLLTAMQKCDDPTNRVCINSKIHSQENFIGFSGVFHIREDGKAERPVFINRIDDGTLTNLVKIY